MRSTALPPGWSKVELSLDHALDLTDSERVAWLAELERTDPDMAHAVRELLTDLSRLNAAGFMAEPLFVRFPALAPALHRILQQHPHPASGSTHVDERASAVLGVQAGALIGRYRLIRQIDHGGMSSIWLAERADGQLKRTVALKLPYLDPRLSTERLLRERDLLAALSHPQIARLYDAGISAAGQPYLAMEYIEGLPLLHHCDERSLSIRERLLLFMQALDAVQFAHAALIIHRDLKPSNMLVTPEGRVVLLDFGIGKLLTSPGEVVTQLGRALTPAYASPEQVTGQPLGTASDIYSLGVILYELLTGRRPHQPNSTAPGALEAAILDEPVRAPSRCGISKSAAASRNASSRVLANTLAGDLDTIVLKALKKDPAERYVSVTALLQDIFNYLNHLPVSARPDSLWYRSSRFTRRYRWQISAVALTLLIAIGGAGTSAWQAHVARQERDRAVDLASRNKSILETMGWRFAVPTATARQLDRALAPTDSSLDRPLRSRLNCVHASLLAQSGRSAAAVEILDRELAQLSSPSAITADCLMSRQLVALHSGDGPGAVRYGELALAELRRAQLTLPDDEAALLKAIADGYFHQDDIGQGNRYYELAVQKAGERGLGSAFAPLLQEWARANLKAGATLRGVDLLQQAMDALAKDHPQTWLFLVNWGRALESAGRYSEAREAYEQACRQTASVNITGEGSCLVGLTSVALQLQDQATATRHFDATLQVLNDPLSIYPQLEGKHILVQAQLELAAGNLEIARHHFDRLLSRNIEHENTIHAALGKAEVELRSGNPSAALTHAQIALQMSTTLQGGIPYSSFSGLSSLMLGRTWQQLGDQRQTRIALEHAVAHLSNTVEPEHVQLKVARRLLAGAIKMQ